MYLFIIIDLYSRYIVDYQLSTTLDRQFVLDCLKRAFMKGKPEIINSDQGGQFTNIGYVKLLKSEKIRISMNGKGPALDNIFVERFFRALKYEDIYLNEYVTPKDLRKGLQRYINYYNACINPWATPRRLVITRPCRLPKKHVRKGGQH